MPMLPLAPSFWQKGNSGTGWCVMIETAMIFALGFLVASAIGFVLLNAVWRRAVRLTTKRVESTLPLSMIEIKADKDQLRAEFAMTTRKLEVNLEQLRDKANEYVTENAFKAETIRTLKEDIAQKDATIARLEMEASEQEERLREANRQIVERQSALEAATLAVRSKEADLRLAAKTISDKDIEADRTRIDIVSLQTQIEHLRLQNKGHEVDLTDMREKLAASHASMLDTSEALTAERKTIAALKSEIKTLQSTLVEKDRHAATLAEEVTAARNELAGQSARLVQEIKDRERAETSLKEALDLVQTSKSESDALKARLEENEAKAALKPVPGIDTTEDFTDQAQMREKINQIAAEVAQMTLLLEGSGSPIATILAQSPPPPDLKGLSTPISLADRVRALRDRAENARVRI